MDQYLDSAYDVTTQLFGQQSGIPWWAWMFVLVAVFWKVLVPEQKSARQAAEDRDTAMLAEIFGEAGGKGGKKGKKK